MTYLQAENLTKSYGTRVLFENISLTIDKGQKVALVARNGSGKTTLFNILSGKDTADSGQVRILKDIRMAYLPQEPELLAGSTILENVLSGGNVLIEALRAYENALEKQAEADTPQHRKLLETATAQMDVLKAWDYEHRIRQILTRLNITRLDQPVSTLSGGQRKRVALAKVLIEEPDLLLMDEPTNHLDLDMIEWLEEYLSRGTLALLLITHDRYFLDRITNEIIEMEDGRLYRYKGNYGYYVEKKAEREEQQSAHTEKARNLLRKELEWMRRQPKARSTKAKYRIDAFYDLKEKAQGKAEQGGIELNVKMSRLGSKILECHQVSKRFGDLVILDDFDYIFQKKERLGIVGPNGVGKTSFLEILTGTLPPDSGYMDTGETVVFGYYRQSGLKLPEDKRVIEVVTDIAEVIPMGNGETLTATQLLQQFGFDPPRQYTYVSTLSGGERRRLYLLTILVKNPNFLILDEPTNDLDLITLNTLEEFLAGFGGCLIVVTHDRYFLDKLADHLFVFEGEGRIKDFNGRYSEYRDMIQAEEREAREKLKEAKVQEQQAGKTLPTDKKKASFKEKREFEELEKEIELLENRKEELEGLLAAGQGSHEEFAAWSRELQGLQHSLESKTDRWLELSELM